MFAGLQVSNIIHSGPQARTHTHEVGAVPSLCLRQISGCPTAVDQEGAPGSHLKKTNLPQPQTLAVITAPERPKDNKTPSHVSSTRFSFPGDRNRADIQPPATFSH